jgi:hypothetical protein
MAGSVALRETRSQCGQTHFCMACACGRVLWLRRAVPERQPDVIGKELLREALSAHLEMKMIRPAFLSFLHIHDSDQRVRVRARVRAGEGGSSTC